MKLKSTEAEGLWTRLRVDRATGRRRKSLLETIAVGVLPDRSLLECHREWGKPEPAVKSCVAVLLCVEQREGVGSERGRGGRRALSHLWSRPEPEGVLILYLGLQSVAA